jgi:hypothetical protein
MIAKLSEACYTVTLLFHVGNTNTLKTIYFACFRSVRKYEIGFGVVGSTVKI